MSGYTNHPAADLFPMIDGKEYLAFRADIEAHGQRETVKVFKGQILDGRNRVRACNDIGVAIQYEEVETDDPVAYVVSHNIARRHLSTKQRAAIAAELATLKHGTNQYAEKVELSNDNSKTITLDEAAEMMQVGKASVSRAKKVKETDPQAHEAAKRGEKPRAEKNKAADRVSWRNIAVAEGFSGASNSTFAVLREQLSSVVPEVFENSARSGILAEHEPTLRDALRAMKIEKDGAAVVAENRSVAESIELPETLQQRFDRKLAAAQRALEAEYELRIQARTQVELQIVLDQYNAIADKHKKTIAAYKGVFTRTEYKSLLGLLHTDRLPGLDDVQRAKFERMFNVVKSKEFELCGDDGATGASTLPKTVADLMAMKHKKQKGA
jgi:hypothetical protein